MKRSLLSVGVAALAVTILTAFAIAGDKHDHKDKKGVAIGAEAPGFTLQDQDGKSHSLSDFAGKIVVLEWFNEECPYVQKHYSTGNMNSVASTYADKGVVWLAINSTKNKTNEDNKKIAGEWNINRAILNDAEGTVGKAYGARTTPHMFIINADGKLAYMGAIDSKSSADASDIPNSTNYVAKALDELLANQSVSQAETKPYGCSVKYKK